MTRNGKRVANRSGVFVVWIFETSRILTLYQILRADFMSRRKHWELQQARSAPEAPAAPDDEDMAETFDATKGESLEIRLIKMC